MIRAAAAVIALLLACGLPVQAQTLPARALIVTDGRSDTGATAPLLVVLHGLTGSGRIMQRKTGFDALARAEGFVVAYPNGTGRRWDYAAQSGDVAYLSALLGAFTRAHGIDPARIYLVGYSNGGAMALRMACTLRGRIAGIAVVAMTQPLDLGCEGGPPVPALFIHGARDPIVPATGLPARRSFAGLLSLEQTLAVWSLRNRCAGPLPLQEFDQTEGPDTARITRYLGCAEPLWAAVLSGQGHDWPGAPPSLRLLLGPSSREMDAAAFSWQFLAGQ